MIIKWQHAYIKIENSSYLSKNVDFKIVKERKNIAILYFYYLPIHIGKKQKKKEEEECVVNEE